MLNNIEEQGYIPHFSGHETFPLRQMWLKKAFDQRNSGDFVPKSLFSDESAIARFGVGKNMVSSIRHWALACGVIEETKDRAAFKVTKIGKMIFADGGLDPYSEDPATAWYAHWMLAGVADRSTTWFWVFNCVATPSFTRDDLLAQITEYARRRDIRLSSSTLGRDIETCIKSYVPRATGGTPEDIAEPMLAELGLIQEERKGLFSFRRGPKATLSDGMFACALIDYWDRIASKESSLAFETIAYAPGSPGRVFKLDEDSVAERLFGLGDLTRGLLSWTDSEGIRQVYRKPAESDELAKATQNLLKAAYGE